MGSPASGRELEVEVYIDGQCLNGAGDGTSTHDENMTKPRPRTHDTRDTALSLTVRLTVLRGAVTTRGHGGAFTAQDGASTVLTVRLPRNTVALPEKSHRYHRGAVLGAMGMQPASARARSGGFASLTAESGGRRTPFCQKSVDTARPRQRSQAAALAPCRWRRAGLRASSAADCGSHRRREGAEMSGGCTAGA